MTETNNFKPDTPNKECRDILDIYEYGLAEEKSQYHSFQDCSRVFLDLEQDRLVAAVADGISTLSHSQKAAQLGIEEFAKYLPGQEMSYKTLKNAIKSANQRLIAEARILNAELGATLTAIVLEKSRAWVAHLGDTRLYQMRGGKLLLKTTDHTKAEELIQAGQLTKEQAENDVSKDTLTNWLGDTRATADISSFPTQPNDIFLLVSDGITKILDEKQLEDLLKQERDAQTLANEIMEQAKLAGIIDDTTVVVVKVK